MAVERYRDPRCTIDERVGDLLARMSLEEKLAQLGCAWITTLMGPEGFSVERAREVAPHGIGEVTRISGATALRPIEAARLMNTVQRYMVEQTRLGIPVLVHEEGTGGFLARDASVFPQALALAATFDPALTERVAAAVRDQMLAVGARHCLAPVLDVARDPRWGRVEETFGEDPYLTGVLGTAYVRGLQSDDLTRGVLATGKHFLGHAMPEGGRNHGPVHLGPRELRDVYAEPFAVAISEAGLGSIMNSYSSVDGAAPAGSRSILTDLLRDELGFTGVVVADYFAVGLLLSHHHIATDKREAARRALVAGLDLELPETDCYGEPLRGAIEAGEVSAETVDLATARVLAAKFALGLFEHPFVDAEGSIRVFETPDQRALAHEAATESLVLLRNDGVLPLAASARKIAMIGPGADDEWLLQGDYHYPAHIRVFSEEQGGDNSFGDLSLLPRTAGEWRPGPYFTHHVTPLQGLRSVVGDGVEVSYAPGCDVTDPDASGLAEAVEAARRADVAIVVVAGRSGLTRACTVGEARDAVDLRLTGRQEDLVAAVARTGVPTVCVVLSGRVHDLSAIDAQVGALIQAWPLGEEGGRALADVLLGRVSPSGRLPVSLPRTVGQVPAYSAHRSGGSTAMFYGEYSDGPTTPLYGFGHGLTYSVIAYANLRVATSTTREMVTVEFDVTNTGERAATEVAQLYVRDVAASVARPERQLVGFARVALEPGECVHVCMHLHPSRLAFTTEALERVTEPGEFRVVVGGGAFDPRLEATVTLAGDVAPYPLTGLVPTAVELSPAGVLADPGAALLGVGGE